MIQKVRCYGIKNKVLGSNWEVVYLGRKNGGRGKNKDLTDFRYLLNKDEEKTSGSKEEENKDKEDQFDFRRDVMKNTLKGIEVHCDDCGKIFRIEKLETDWVNDSVRRTYFECPYCKKEYTSFYEDAKVRENIKDIQKLQKKMNGIVEQNKEIMESLKQKYEA